MTLQLSQKLTFVDPDSANTLYTLERAMMSTKPHSGFQLNSGPCGAKQDEGNCLYQPRSLRRRGADLQGRNMGTYHVTIVPTRTRNVRLIIWAAFSSS